MRRHSGIDPIGVLCLGAALSLAPTSQSAAQTIRVDIGDGAAVNTFVPTQTFGAGIDRMNSTAVEKLFTQPAIDTVLSAGWQTVSYRQNTELHAEAWHWNPNGAWSWHGPVSAK